MNSSSSCHEIPDCPGCYVDAFRGSYLKKTRNKDNAFILSHWHGDHYGNLPKDGKYQGPAPIHCTPVTAALLREMHRVPDHLVIEHEYGVSWTYTCIPKMNGTSNSSSSSSNKKSTTTTTTTTKVQITFYDANHCPGAAIILFQVGNNKAHLHTGDMRYHPKMQSYPLLREAALAKQIDVVLLDTTYGNPKHDFVPQETAIESVACYVEELLGNKKRKKKETTTVDDDNDDKHQQQQETLVLLSCYSIGKEKVLWEASTRTNQLVYVNERKYKMMQCINQDPNNEDVSCQIISKCTQNPKDSDIHVIPMGLAGELWPFFQPNYWACAEYANELSSKQYTKVVAFLPTGWADASNWNKKNAITTMDCKGITVEIRLIPYSEHSAFSELQEFVNFLQPRKVIPTVFKDENDKRKIESRFQIDTHRAKQFFIQSIMMKKKNPTTTTPTSKTTPPPPTTTTKMLATTLTTTTTDPPPKSVSPDSAVSSCRRKRKQYDKVQEEQEQEQEDIPRNAFTDKAEREKTKAPENLELKEEDEIVVIDDPSSTDITMLQAMGFSKRDAKYALRECHGNVQAAVEKILKQQQQQQQQQKQQQQGPLFNSSSKPTNEIQIESSQMRAKEASNLFSNHNSTKSRSPSAAAAAASSVKPKSSSPKSATKNQAITQFFHVKKQR